MNAFQQPVILVIDHDSSFRGDVRTHLEAHGYTVLLAENGPAGLQIARSRPIDLILVDLHLPGMNGFEILSEVHRQDPLLPVVVTSGSADVSDVAEALRLGAAGCLMKPAHDLSIVLQTMTTALDRAGSPRKNWRSQVQPEARVERKADDLTVLHSMLQGLVESIRKLLGCGEIHESGPLLLEEFGTHLKARGGSFYAVSESELCLIYSLDGDHAVCSLPMPLPPGTVFCRGVKALEPFIVEDIATDDWQGSGWRGYLKPCCMVFPFLNHSGGVFAILTLHNPEKGVFLPQDLEIGAILASFAAEALQTAEAMATVQQHEELLPQPRKLQAAGALSADIAHDFNNILSAIVGYTDLSLHAEDLPGRLKANLEQVKKASRRAENLVQQILAISRREASKAPAGDVVPAMRENLPRSAGHSEPVSHPGDYNMPGGSERILFVDDEETLAEMAGEMLKKLGYAVQIMTDSSQARTAVLSAPERYDLIIIDQAMPGISGMDLAHAILASRVKTPIILYSGYPATVSEDEARAIGIRKVLVKPLSMVLLSQAVRQVLDEAAHTGA